MRELSRTLRLRAAILMALAYAFCVLAPSAALAVAANPASLHCLDEMSGLSAPSHHDALSHTHADGAVHHHDRSTPDHHSGGSKAPDGSCCGLFGVTALAHDPGLTFGVSAPASQAVSAAANGLDGRAPAPLHRPPIA
jgi:hypothetical protein